MKLRLEIDILFEETMANAEVFILTCIYLKENKEGKRKNFVFLKTAEVQVMTCIYSVTVHPQEQILPGFATQSKDESKDVLIP